MTQEQIMRQMLEGFVNDPPDTPHQEGFLSAVIVIANEVMGFDLDDPLILRAEKSSPSCADLSEAITKAKTSLRVIAGGKQDEPSLKS